MNGHPLTAFRPQRVNRRNSFPVIIRTVPLHHHSHWNNHDHSGNSRGYSSNAQGRSAKLCSSITASLRASPFFHSVNRAAQERMQELGRRYYTKFRNLELYIFTTTTHDEMNQLLIKNSLSFSSACFALSLSLSLF